MFLDLFKLHGPRFLRNTTKKRALQRGRQLLKIAENIFDYLTDWDVIILLDGCRFDTFKKICRLRGNLHKKVWHGTCTLEWASNSIIDQYKNLIYVSANPFVSKFYLKQWNNSNPFYILDEVWDFGWDPQLRTVPAEAVTHLGVHHLKKHPKKKLFLHYMQPHHPYIGKTKIHEYGWIGSQNPRQLYAETSEVDHVHTKLEKGLLSRKLVLQAYEDNLHYVLEMIQPVLKAAAGKRVVITSDHGNCFGEYGIYAHPGETYVPELLEVPLFFVN